MRMDPVLFVLMDLLLHVLVLVLTTVSLPAMERTQFAGMDLLSRSLDQSAARDRANRGVLMIQ